MLHEGMRSPSTSYMATLPRCAFLEFGKPTCCNFGRDSTGMTFLDFLVQKARTFSENTHDQIEERGASDLARKGFFIS
jgi:hypothetical protein